MRALILIDIQNDFLPGGALPVPEGDRIVPIVNHLQSRFDLVVATQDWHPPNHGSFAANHPGRKTGEVIELNGLKQILWPIHCVQNTAGAAFAPGVETHHIDKLFQKGTDPATDSYSGFFDNGRRKATGLDEYLRGQGIDEIFLAGLATDYCVKFTALDAVNLGYKTHLIEDACRGVNLHPDDIVQAISEMQRTGVQVMHSTSAYSGLT
jgi:nicotinamidase/pyrazinamidase